MKSRNKILFLIVTSILIGTIGLPATFSLGTGQHQFKQVDPDNVDEFCNKCHGNGDSIQTELAASDNGLYNGGIRIHNTVGCAGCHALTQGYGNSDGTKLSHAARIPDCIQCHNPTYIGLTLGNVTAELESTTEAHREFNEETDSVACIGCHTSISVSGTISYSLSVPEQRMGLTIGN